VPAGSDVPGRASRSAGPSIPRRSVSATLRSERERREYQEQVSSEHQRPSSHAEPDNSLKTAGRSIGEANHR
jgi:hypothetical protein